MDAGPSGLRVLTYNVWFSEKLRAARARALVELIRRSRPDVVCLQEVVPPFAARHRMM